jgi:hypothetical protein
MPLSPHRLAWAGAFFLLAGLLAVPAIVFAQSGSSQTHPLVAAAARYDGMYEGECWVFVKKVVAEALGIEMGFDYRDGYLEAGAKEIAVEFARPGDIVQIADDHYTEPDADYPGLHTLIIAEVLEPGVFAGWDSNSNWDGIVRFRERYAPAEVAARYGNLNFRIYRFPTPDEPLVDPSALYEAPKARLLQPGDVAVVLADGDSLNLRDGPGLDRAILTQLRDGVVVTVTGGPVRAHGHTWVSVTSVAGSGWVASEYLSYRGSEAQGSRTGTESAATTGGPAPLFNHRATVPFIAVGN